jgi:hypothetical protein
MNIGNKASLIVFTLMILFVTTATYATDRGLDPTRPLSGSKNANSEIRNSKNLILESIFHGSHGEKTHVVVINGKTMKVNDTIGEYRLVAVNDESVVLRSPEKRLKLHVFSSVIKH